MKPVRGPTGQEPFPTLDLSPTELLASLPTVGAAGLSEHDPGLPARPAGRILKTTDGGNSWYVAPEDPTKAIPTNDYVAKLAVCAYEPNVVFGGGLAGNGTDGFLVKGSAPVQQV